VARGRRVVERVDVDAPVERVWQALCHPHEVSTWDGATPLDVPDGYPTAGQHARWQTSVGPFRVVLHDRVRAVTPPSRLSARLTYGLVDLDEEYRLTTELGHTVVTSENVVRSRPPGLAWCAAPLVRRSVRSALARLAVHCARNVK
jgi:uncharacterized protein YndB with AHSA1/START domain